MKIRRCFVSNSSSSSFIVGLPFEPQSVEDVESIFFPDGLNEPYLGWRSGANKVTTREAATRLWIDIQTQRLYYPDIRERVVAHIVDGGCDVKATIRYHLPLPDTQKDALCTDLDLEDWEWDEKAVEKHNDALDTVVTAVLKQVRQRDVDTAVVYYFRYWTDSPHNIDHVLALSVRTLKHLPFVVTGEA